MSGQTTEELQSHVVLNSAESLKVARAYANLLGEIPSSFTSVLRTLISDDAKGSLSSNGKFSVTRLLKSKSIFTSAYFAGSTFRSKELSQLGGSSANELIQIFSPQELSGLVAIIYLYRRASTQVGEDYWKDLATQAKQGVEIGGLVGNAIPKIGLSMGMFVGGLPYISLGMFQRHDEKSFKEYRRHLLRTKSVVDLSYEMKTWGCTRYDIASVFLQIFGFGVTVANAFAQGLTCKNPLGEGLDDDAYRFKITSIWIESLLRDQREPQIKHRGDYYPTKEGLDQMLQDAKQIIANGSMLNFLDRTKEDLTPEQSSDSTSPSTPEVRVEEETPPLVE